MSHSKVSLIQVRLSNHPLASVHRPWYVQIGFFSSEEFRGFFCQWILVRRVLFSFVFSSVLLQCLQLAVLSILLTAPTGAGLIAITGPFFLTRTPDADRLRRKSELSVDDDHGSLALLQDIENNDHRGGGSLDDAGTISKGVETDEVFLADACVDGVGFGRTASSQPKGWNGIFLVETDVRQLVLV
ncbi:hypothetical protein V1264_011351 [Littorina saxatilis]|uniref:Transmembrane protein n=1 Tax=Littorina saxatilis TaxID=31220 RepID=A0AAN9BYE4_9CAEN